MSIPQKPDFAYELITIHYRHLNIHQNNRERVLFQRLHGFCAMTGNWVAQVDAVAAQLHPSPAVAAIDEGPVNYFAARTISRAARSAPMATG